MQLGDLRLDPVPAGRFRLDGGAMFGIVPKPLWSRVAPPDEKNRIDLALNCLLIRDARRAVLVETGLGDKWGAKEREIFAIGPSEEGILPALGRLGVLPEAVDTVILTHLHFDHAGGATSVGPDGSPVPAFPNATYVVQKEEWEFAGRLNERTRASYRAENFESLGRGGRIRLVEGEEEILPGVSVLPLPGHTPGLQGVLVEGGGRTLFYPSDLVPTAAHVPYPYIMGYDVLPLTTLETKKRILPRAAAGGWILYLVHEPRAPIGTLVESGPRFEWRALGEE